MRLLRITLFMTLAVMVMAVRAQLSPGDLTTAHAELEGMSNCTHCHDLGNKVTNAKCLDCHKELKALIGQKRGYHVSAEVKGKDCFSCHSEHHGRKFQMVHFDEKKFDHALTGYKLEGGHKTVDCRKCHAPEHIKDKQAKYSEKTFMGLDRACLSCHKDQHQGTLSRDCAECHGMEKWKPASRFDHDRSEFKLRGGHVSVDCAKCHEQTTRKGQPFQVFADVPHADCKSCHADPHKAHFVNACAQCHVDESFKQTSGIKRFDHGTTPFKLNGKHKDVDCFECHKRTSDPLTVFQDRIGVRMDQCATCHKDPHEGRFGTDCAKCHQEKGFKALRSMDQFDHSLTDYPLQGKHVGVDCKKCHKGAYTDPLVFDACNKCHEDYHQGDFAKNGSSPDCVECHFLTDGFDVSMYSLEQHASSRFPLEGAHIATPCMACHLVDGAKRKPARPKQKWVFRDLATACYDCHDNVHGEDFVQNGVTDCKRCHVSENWYPKLFDHDLTRFPLVGEHVKVECKQCHKAGDDGRVASFKVQRFECADCHK
jgi:hypothetical protein